ncbi:acetyl-CoA carboxylase biotin carboxyl carrier protein subunit, partial [Mycobacterium tuberculosis]|nr:acetyl-CoA carboxylase biotin carboxyl carrier protein subunit [Mycobacterium tuberculosis]
SAGTGEDGDRAEGSVASDDGSTAVTAPVPGSLVDFLVDDGAEVAEGDEVAVLSAMKMETRVQAGAAGTLTHAASVGDVVVVGEAIARI